MSARSAKQFVRKPLNHTPHFSARFGATYFVTICCQNRGVNQLCQNAAAREIFETAARYDREQTWHLSLLLLMPDHLHALVSIGGDRSLSTTIAAFKRATAKFAGVTWQRNFFDHRVRDSNDPFGKHMYIRQNPVRAGLVTDETAWPYVLDRANLEAMAVR